MAKAIRKQRGWVISEEKKWTIVHLHIALRQEMLEANQSRQNTGGRPMMMTRKILLLHFDTKVAAIAFIGQLSGQIPLFSRKIAQQTSKPIS
jgi:hypothetical protein